MRTCLLCSQHYPFPMQLSNRHFQAEFCNQRSNLLALRLRRGAGTADWSDRPGSVTIIDDRKRRSYSDVDQPIQASTCKTRTKVTTTKQIKGPSSPSRKPGALSVTLCAGIWKSPWPRVPKPGQSRYDSCCRYPSRHMASTCGLHGPTFPPRSSVWAGSICSTAKCVTVRCCRR